MSGGPEATPPIRDGIRIGSRSTEPPAGDQLSGVESITCRPSIQTAGPRRRPAGWASRPCPESGVTAAFLSSSSTPSDLDLSHPWPPLLG